MFSGIRARGRTSGEDGSALIENIEALLFAGVLALIIHQYVFQAFKIPTGSMAPTVLGQHKDLECPNCGRWFPVGDRSDPVQLSDKTDIICSNCGHKFDRQVVDQARCAHFPSRPERFFWRGYYRVLAGRFVYNFTDPARWDVVVFKKPEDTPEPVVDYIKRIVGMPGETIDIRRGNIYADGRIVRKPDNVRDAMWIPVYDSRNEKLGDGAFSPAWRAREGALDRGGDTLTLIPGNGDRARAGFRGSGDPNQNPINTYLDYNHWDPPHFPVGEIKFDARFRTEGAGEFAVEIGQDGRIYRCVLAVPDDSSATTVSLYIDDERVGQADVQLKPDRWSRLVFMHVDASLRVEIDGRVALYHEFEPHLNIEFISSGLFLEAATSAPVELREITIHRDNYYFHRELALPDIIRIPEGQYMMLGDNSRHSSDSRYWGMVPEENIVGKAVIVWWPPGELRVLD